MCMYLHVCISAHAACLENFKMDHYLVPPMQQPLGSWVCLSVFFLVYIAPIDQVFSLFVSAQPSHGYARKWGQKCNIFVIS